MLSKLRFKTLHSRLITACICSCLIATSLVLLILYFKNVDLSQSLITWVLALSLALSWLVSAALLKNLNKSIQALQVSLLNLQDGEFNATVSQTSNDEFGQISQQVNQVAAALRQQRQNIYHRELLLDKVNQNSPLAMLLFDQNQRLIYSNLAARQWLNKGHNQDGSLLSDLTLNWPQTISQAIEHGQDGLFTLEPITDGEKEKENAKANSPKNSQEAHKAESQTWHLSTGDFQLNGQQHKLYLFKQLTREFNRQEVSVWKKVIRVISHEINNSIAPISSMTHSGKILIEQKGDEKLSLVFNTIDKRIKHLSQFIAGYAEFARLPEPQRQVLDWPAFLNELQQQTQFTFQIQAEQQDLQQLKVDPSQFEQLLINLLKNAHESGSKPDAIKLDLQTQTSQSLALLTIEDAGKGMNEQELQNALIPFYSTKQQGTGLGLALCREIVEAHHGQISLQNKVEGGLQVRIGLPLE
ncbi:sensor histidine kinase [Saccharobesus litoralis]|nr:ATP-binding protein [Saccharobesus litoralis]